MIMLDTSIWVALLDQDDPCHEKAKNIAGETDTNKLKIYDHIYIETLTVLRNKISESACYRFMYFFKDINQGILLSDNENFSLANIYFFQFSKLSFTDCLLIASAKLNKTEIKTFDKELIQAWEKVKKSG